MTKNTQATQIQILAQTTSIVRARDLAKLGIAHETVRRLARQGEVLQVGRGLYVLPEANLTEFHTLVEVAKKIPQGVFSLLTALAFHDLTTVNPAEVWLTLEGTTYCPKLDQVELRVTRATGAAFSFGVEMHEVEGVPLRIYSPAKTVATCFQHRQKVGLDVALEALAETWRTGKATLEELRLAARSCRMDRLMRPYLEALATWEPSAKTARSQ